MESSAGGLKNRLIYLWNDLKDPKVDVARGATRKIARSAHVSGDQSGVGTSQVVTCEIDRRPVEIWMPSVPMIEEGDELIVAGRSKFGKLEAYAYRNFANGTSGHWDYQLATWFWFGLSMLVLLAISCMMPLFFLIMLFFVPMVGVRIAERLRIYKSYKLVMAAPAKSDGPDRSTPAASNTG